MQSQHLLCTLNVSLAPSAPLLGPSRRPAEWLGHLLGMDTKITRSDSAAEMQDALEPALTITELAARLRVSAQTIYDLRSQGRGPRGYPVGRQLRFRVSEIDAWLARMEEADAERHPALGR
jgi:excisionase family DNA binding protein